MKYQEDINENECNEADQMRSKRHTLDERHQEDQHLDHHQPIGGQLLDIDYS